MSDTTFQEMTRYVSLEKKNRLNRFLKPIDATRSLLGDLIIRYILCKYYGLQNSDIVYAFKKFGKPYLSQQPHLHFNISHSGDWVVGVVATDVVGIDIEKITIVKSDIPLMVLADEEQEKFKELDEVQRNNFFFELWTLKESYAKTTGKGLSEGFNTLNISTNSDVIRLEKEGKPVQVYLEMLDYIDGYKFCLCSLTKHKYTNIKLLLIDKFRQEAIKVLEHFIDYQ